MARSPCRLPRTPQAGAKPAHAGAGGSGNLPRPLTIHMIAAGSDPVQAARPPPSAHYGQQPPPPQHAQHAQHAQQQQRMSACNRSLSMPALPGALHGSPATPTGRGGERFLLCMPRAAGHKCFQHLRATRQPSPLECMRQALCATAVTSHHFA